MLKLPIYALGTTLFRSFKLIKAPVSKVQYMNLLIDEPHLLSASYEINGQSYQVMIDTGATISCIPEHGKIAELSRSRIEKANLAIQLPNGNTEYVSKKIRSLIRPKGSKAKPLEAQLYVQDNISHIFGFHALLGLKHLKLFELSIDIKDGKIHIYHQGKLIGYESPALANIKASMKVIDNIAPNDVENSIRNILNAYKGVFSDLNAKPINGRPMRFLTTHQRPVFAKQRHYNIDEVLAMKEHVKSLLDKGIIEPSNSGYAAQSRIIPKKNGTGRLVVNYIPLNAVTYRDSYMLPHISDILGALQGKQYFTTMDCTQGFYQIEVDYRDRHKTAFSTPVGNFQFKRCPFGARNSCAVYQAEMNRIFNDGLYTRCVVYVDDILVFGRTREEHDENLEWVLKKCQEHNVKLKLEKCTFGKEEVQYLGFVISGRYIGPIPQRVDALKKSRPPRDKTELKSVIGKLNFYSRFIPNYSQQLEPLRNLLTKNKDYQWTNYHQEAFEKLIGQLDRSEKHLIAPNHTHKQIILRILHNSVEAILTDDNNQIIMRVSRLLTTSESNYGFPEKQLLALTFAVNKFRLFVTPDKLTVVVPDSGLKKILSLVKRPERVDNILLRMPCGFDSFDFRVDESLQLDLTNKRKDHVAEEIFYVDGSCKANGKPNCRASWAVCAEYDKNLEVSGLVEDHPSNQSAELSAAINACKIAKRKGLSEITIVTDSKYLYNAATEWTDKWKNNDWKDNKNKPVINTGLFKDLLKAKCGLEIEWIHVKGHSDNQGNIRADLLAKSLLDKKAAILSAMSSSSSRIQDDEEISSLKDEIYNGEHPNLKIIGDSVYYIDHKLPEGSQNRLYVPKASRHWLLNLAHDDETYGGHLGVKKTFRKLTRFWWPKLHRDVEAYVKSCDTCQKFKNPVGLPPGYLHSIPVSEAFENIHLDIVGPLKTSNEGHKYVITATDAFSKWAFAKPSQTVRTSEMISFIEENILSVHGKPKRFITDRGTQFTSKEWKDFIDKLGVEHKLTSAYHPQSNGIDERLNGTLMRILRAYVDKFQEKWDEHLKWSLYVYNTTVHESTGYSPYQLLHGLDSRSPLKPNAIPASNTADIQQTRDTLKADAAERIKQSQAIQKKYYDRRHQKQDLHIGQLVYIRVHAVPTYLSKKFFIKWDGPCVIIGFVGERDNPKAVTVLDWDNMLKKVVAIQDVKPVVDTYEKPEESIDKTQNGGSHTVVNSSDSWYFPPPCSYMQDEPDTNAEPTSEQPRSNGNLAQPSLPDPSNEISHQSLRENRQPQPSVDLNMSDQDENGLNIVEKTMSGPTTSSPRRVTINESVHTYFYPAEACTAKDDRGSSNLIDLSEQVEESESVAELTKSHAEATEAERNTSSETANEETQSEEQPSTGSGPANEEPSRNKEPEVAPNDKQEESATTPEISTYIEIDNPRKDPTYKPPAVVLKELDVSRLSNSAENLDKSSRGSLIPRYDLRAAKRPAPRIIGLNKRTKTNEPTVTQVEPSAGQPGSSSSEAAKETASQMQKRADNVTTRKRFDKRKQ